MFDRSSRLRKASNSIRRASLRRLLARTDV